MEKRDFGEISKKPALLFSILLSFRPKTLVAGCVPVLIVACFAMDRGLFSLSLCMQFLFFILGLQIGTNLVNDYYDCVKGADTEQRVGPVRVTQQKLIAPFLLFLMIVFFFGMSLCLAFLWGWKAFLWGIFFVFLGWSYTAGPFPLAYHGWGDFFAFVFFGPVAVLGQAFLYKMSWDIEVISAGWAMGCLSVALITVNNLRDRKTDAQVNKRTLAVRFGASFSRFQYTISVLMAQSVFILLFLRTKKIIFLIGLFVCLWRSFKIFKTIWDKSLPPSVLNQTLAQTGQFFLLYGIVLSLGILL